MWDFNPRTPRGVRPNRRPGPLPEGQFQSTHPARGATRPARRGRRSYPHFNPRTPRGVRLCPTQRWWHVGNFNPRTPRGVRPPPISWPTWRADISIHAPREGCDHYEPILPCRWCNFNPRTPRGVRREAHYDWSASYIISIHAPREGCDMGGGVAHGIDCISIHAPREGCDALVLAVLVAVSLYFNPRTPRGVRPGAAWTRWSRS